MPDLIILKTCPFCGSIPKVYRSTLEDEHGYFVTCSKKDCEFRPISNVHEHKNTAIDAWNRRA